jgi:hypothetical protein
MKATYTIDSYSYKKYWFGISSMIGPVNFYVLADNLWSIRMSQKPIVHPFNWGLMLFFKDKKKIVCFHGFCFVLKFYNFLQIT